MKLTDILRALLYFFVFVLLQIFWAKHFVFFDTGFCFLYIIFIITLPISIPVPLLLIVSFGCGVVVDMAYDMAGIHTAATLLMAYSRSFIIRFLTPLGGYADNMQPTIQSNGLQWFVMYTFLLTLVHHTMLFFTEASGFSMFFFTLSKILLSTVLTSFMIVSLQYIFLTSFKRSGNKR